MVFICYKSRCLNWQNWEQRQHYVKCSDRGMSGHGEMRCLTGSTEAQWVQNQNEELQCWDCKQHWLCLHYRNLPAGPKTAYGCCPEMVQIRWYTTKAKIWKARKASDLFLGAPCTTAMRWEAIAASSRGNASKTSWPGTSLSPTALMVGFLPPTEGKSRHEETTASPETLVLCPVPELQKTRTLPIRDIKYKRITLESTLNHLFLSHFLVEAGLWTITPQPNSPKPRCSA